MVKTFTGSYCVLFFLLCCGIIPGVIYYLIAQKDLNETPKTIQQTVIVQQPTQDNNIMYCSACGAKKQGKFCQNCGSE